VLLATFASPAAADAARPRGAARAIRVEARASREVGFRGARTCEIRGQRVALDLVMVSPPGEAPFRLAVSGAPATVHLAPPADARAMHHAAVGGAVAFEGAAPGEWAHFVTSKEIALAGGMVRLGRGVLLGDVRGGPGGGAIASVDVGGGVKLPSLAVPCAAIALDEPATADAIEAPKEGPLDGTSWVAKERRLTLRSRPLATAPGYTVEVEYPSALVMSRARAAGRFALLDSWQARSPIEVSGWVDDGEVEGYLPTMRGVTIPRRESPPVEPPPPADKGVYDGPATIPPGTVVYAAAGGRGPWAEVRSDKALRVRWKTDERWVQIVAAPGLGGIAGHGFIDRAAVRLPLAAGAWRVTGAPLASRLGHTATLLQGGKVLVVGGWGRLDGEGGEDPGRRAPLAAAEIFDPDGGAERFTAVAPLAGGRAGHTATLLGDGRVLVAGGERLPGVDDGIALASAEVYDPATGTFSPTGSMTDARLGHTATLLGDGTVLVVGGDDGHGRSLGSAELWDPRDGRFRGIGRLSVRRYDHTATRLPDGGVLIVGGRHKNYGLRDWWTTFPIDTVELFDPARRAFSAVGELPAGGRTRHSCTAIAGGRVLLAGGARETDLDLAGIARSALVWEPGLATWTAAGESGAREEEARGEHSATPLPDGRVLIVSGGFALLYDAETHRWESLAAPTFERAGHTATLLPGGRVLVVGGESPDDKPVAIRPGAELFLPPARR
jgi:hypothetical protein